MPRLLAPYNAHPHSMDTQPLRKLCTLDLALAHSNNPHFQPYVLTGFGFLFIMILFQGHHVRSAGSLVVWVSPSVTAIALHADALLNCEHLAGRERTSGTFLSLTSPAMLGT